jgi:hypothetical protein
MSFINIEHSRIEFSFLSFNNLDIKCALTSGSLLSRSRVSIKLDGKVRYNFIGLDNKLRFLNKVGRNTWSGIDKDIVIIKKV